MNFAEQAFKELFPQKKLPTIDIKYSGKFSPYNANVYYVNNVYSFKLSKEWRGVDNAIKIGLIQSLFLRIFKKRIKKTMKSTLALNSKNILSTTNIDLYYAFTKNLHKSIAKHKSDPILEQSFNRVNEKYFYGWVEIPNLEWGSYTKTTLGNYNYHTDTIRVSKYFETVPELLDYIMYHEILHKKVKFKSKNWRAYSHTSEFRKKEKEFPNQKQMEEKIHNFLRYKRRPKLGTRKDRGSFAPFKDKTLTNLKKWLFG